MPAIRIAGCPGQRQRLVSDRKAFDRDVAVVVRPDERAWQKQITALFVIMVPLCRQVQEQAGVRVGGEVGLGQSWCLR